MRQSLRIVCATIATLVLFNAPCAAEEGMWTFDNVPVERMQAELGWSPDQQWLERVMLATARLPGCSASIVSEQGLVLTNHHCIVACVQGLSSDGANYLESGFLAQSRAEERRCPNMSLSVLAGIENVTERIDEAAAAAAGNFARARNAEIARIEGECSTMAIRCEVVTLYQGGRYSLYRFRRYDDVRLVFAPEQAMAAFGGDADNFNFPRYGADFAFLRVYESGAPARTLHRLSMRFAPVEEGEVVLAAGNPGSTSRLRATAELAFERDVNLPWRLVMLAEQRRRLLEFSELGPAQARVAASALQTIENSYKALAGRRHALADPRAFAHATARESDLQARVRRNRAAQREVGDAWGEVARAQTAYRQFYLEHQLLEARAGERSELFALARDIVRGAAERDRPDAERLPRYSQARLTTIAGGIRADRPIEPDLERISLEVWLSAVQQHFASTSAVAGRILGGVTPEALARRLAGSRLADPDYRMQLWEGGAAAVAASDDPMIAFVRAWDGDARAVRTRFLTQVEGPVALAQERIALVRFRAFADSQYPEANFTPRLSYGRVAGWTETSGAVRPFTRLGGLFERAGDSAPTRISSRWTAARPRLDPDTLFNFTTSVDVIAGNSGGPLLDREGRVVGAVFDGNVHSLGGEYFYDGSLNRAIAVAAPLIRETLIEVYGMHALVAELEA